MVLQAIFLIYYFLRVYIEKFLFFFCVYYSGDLYPRYNQQQSVKLPANNNTYDRATCDSQPPHASHNQTKKSVRFNGLTGQNGGHISPPFSANQNTYNDNVTNYASLARLPNGVPPMYYATAGSGNNSSGCLQQPDFLVNPTNRNSRGSTLDRQQVMTSLGNSPPPTYTSSSLLRKSGASPQPISNNMIMTSSFNGSLRTRPAGACDCPNIA